MMTTDELKAIRALFDQLDAPELWQRTNAQRLLIMYAGKMLDELTRLQAIEAAARGLGSLSHELLHIVIASVNWHHDHKSDPIWGRLKPGDHEAVGKALQELYNALAGAGAHDGTQSK